MLEKLLRYPDLKALGIVKSHAQLKNLIQNYSFPAGKLLTPNCRTWTEQEIKHWIGSRPSERVALRGIAKQLHEASPTERAALQADHRATAQRRKAERAEATAA